jgi:hypothetical protein
MTQWCTLCGRCKQTAPGADVSKPLPTHIGDVASRKNNLASGKNKPGSLLDDRHCAMDCTNSDCEQRSRDATILGRPSAPCIFIAKKDSPVFRSLAASLKSTLDAPRLNPNGLERRTTEAERPPSTR